MMTYTVAANDLEGVIVRFDPHPIPACLFIHQTLNSVYGVDIYETYFHFLFDDITTNQQKELYKDAPPIVELYDCSYQGKISSINQG